MGEVISLDQRRVARQAGLAERVRRGSAPAARPQATFWFDLASPSTYFAAERVDRFFPGVTWRPVFVVAGLSDGSRSSALQDVTVHAATARAAELRMPLVWPEGQPAGRAAMRVAAYAAECGQASAFVLAASRLAFCGGFDLDDPEILAEASAAASLPFEECLRAAGDRDRDAAMESEGERLLLEGADQLPVVGLDGRLFCGEHRVGQAAAAVRDPHRRLRPTPLDEFAG